MDTANQNPTPTPVYDTPVVNMPVEPQPTGKESEGVSSQPEEWVQETAPEAKISKELEEVGVEATKGEVLHIAPELSQAGVQPTGMAAPIPTESTIELPMTEEKAQGILKVHRKVKESITWLAMLIVRQMQILQFKKKGKKV